MRAQPARAIDWTCAWCERAVPASYAHKCEQFDRSFVEGGIKESGWPSGPVRVGSDRSTTPERQCALLRLRVAALEATVAELNARRLASGTEAQRAGTVKQGPVHDGPVPKADAQ